MMAYALIGACPPTHTPSASYHTTRDTRWRAGARGSEAFARACLWHATGGLSHATPLSCRRKASAPCPPPARIP